MLMRSACASRARRAQVAHQEARGVRALRAPRRASSNSTSRKLASLGQTVRTPRQRGERRGQARALGSERRDVLARLLPSAAGSSALNTASMRQLRDRVGLDDLAQQRDHLGVRDQRAAARAGEPVGLRQRAQTTRPGCALDRAGKRRARRANST